MHKAAALAALLLAACDTGGAPPEIEVRDAWARSTVAGQKSSAAYLTIGNSGGPDRLLGVSSPLGRASLHSTSMDDGVMRMRSADALEIPAGSTVVLKPGATHLMITGLNRPLEAGQSVPLELGFERSGRRQVTATVRAAGTVGAGM